MSTFADAARTFFSSSSPPSTLFINCFSSSSCFFFDPSGWPFICDLARCAGLCLFPVVSVLSALRLVPLRNILSASRTGKTGGCMQVNHRFLWHWQEVKNWLKIGCMIQWNKVKSTHTPKHPVTDSSHQKGIYSS